jgi:flagellar hook-basal body complex protein FliE
MRANFEPRTQMIIRPETSGTGTAQIQGQPQKPEESFGATVSNFLEEVNANQVKAEQESIKLARGESRNVHEAMMSLEKANMSLQFTLQVRNKVIEAYQEIMRMQV